MRKAKTKEEFMQFAEDEKDRVIYELDKKFLKDCKPLPLFSDIVLFLLMFFVVALSWYALGTILVAHKFLSSFKDFAIYIAVAWGSFYGTLMFIRNFLLTRKIHKNYKNTQKEFKEAEKRLKEKGLI